MDSEEFKPGETALVRLKAKGPRGLLMVVKTIIVGEQKMVVVATESGKLRYLRREVLEKATEPRKGDIVFGGRRL